MPNQIVQEAKHDLKKKLKYRGTTHLQQQQQENNADYEGKTLVRVCVDCVALTFIHFLFFPKQPRLGFAGSYQRHKVRASNVSPRIPPPSTLSLQPPSKAILERQIKTGGESCLPEK